MSESVIPPNNPVLKPKIDLAEKMEVPQEYRTVKNGIIVSVDKKFVTIRLRADIAQHISAFKFGKFVEIKFLKDGGTAPDITSWNKSIDEL